LIAYVIRRWLHTDDRLTKPRALALGSKLSEGLLRRWHPPIDDHALGEAGGARVTILSDNVLKMSKALAGGVLHAPGPALWAPLNLAPQPAADGEVVGLGVDAANFNNAVASAICHFSFSLSLPPQ
jgi:hypothetical protein